MVKYFISILFYLLLVVFIHASQDSLATNPSNESVGSYKIEGKITVPPGDNALENTRILIDEGLYVGIPQVDGTFVICGIPSGSYIVSVISPLHVFEPVRVDINAKGKIRARKVNFIQPGENVPMKYPLNFETHGIPNYFQKREVYRLTDVIMNPMFLTLLVPLALLLILPKLASQDQKCNVIFNKQVIFFNQISIHRILVICLQIFLVVRKNKNPINNKFKIMVLIVDH